MGSKLTLDVMQLRGNESEENVWNPRLRAGKTSVNLAPWLQRFESSFPQFGAFSRGCQCGQRENRR